jgi:hypothetical protein
MPERPVAAEVYRCRCNPSKPQAEGKDGGFLARDHQRAARRWLPDGALDGRAADPIRNRAGR